MKRFVASLTVKRWGPPQPARRGFRGLIALALAAVVIMNAQRGHAQAGPIIGYADLHTHPATHLAFGATRSGKKMGTGGIMWGLPCPWADTSVPGGTCRPWTPLMDPREDLAACVSDHAGNGTWALVAAGPLANSPYAVALSTAHQIVLELLDSGPGFGYTHAADGATDYARWPNARGITHKGMHIAWLRRAYESGLRLVFMVSTDNETLAEAWLQDVQPKLPQPISNWDFLSAQVQTQFINNLAAVNNSWMTIVKTPDDLRAAAAANKLAVIVGVEHSYLTADQILQLWDPPFNVRTVIPIHVANNTFGGAAVYDDLFNGDSQWLNKGSPYSWLSGNFGFFQIMTDPKLTFRLSPHPQELGYQAIGNLVPPGFPGALVPIDAGQDPSTPVDGCTLGYWPCSPWPPTLSSSPSLPGHRNALGLAPPLQAGQPPEVFKLMQKGFIVDVAHMSENATEQMIQLAEQYHYPLISSHSGLRDATAHSQNERDVRRDHAMRIQTLGGMFGLGEKGDTTPRVGNPAPAFGDPIPATLYTSDPCSTDPYPPIGMVGGKRSFVFYKPPNPGCAQPWNFFTNHDPYWPESSPGTFSPMPLVHHLAPQATIDRLDVNFSFTPPACTGKTPPPIVVKATIGSRQYSGSVSTICLPAMGAKMLSTATAQIAISPPISRSGLGSSASISSTTTLTRIAVAAHASTVTPGLEETLAQAYGLSTTSFTANIPPPFTDASRETLPATHLELWVTSGRDDLRAGSHASAVVNVNGSSTPFTFDLNGGQLWDGYDPTSVQIPRTLSVHHVILGPLPAGTQVKDLVSFGIKTDLGQCTNFGDIGCDKWAVDAIQLQVLADPVANWVSDYSTAMGIFGSGGVALGTDFDGLSPLVPYSEQSIPSSYRLPLAPNIVTVGAGGAGMAPAPMQSSMTLGPRTFDISKDGIAQYGMIPDFLKAVSQQPGGSAAVDSLFHTAEGVYQLWVKVNAAALSIALSTVHIPIGTPTR
jgi:microsomal dipeptidase-like Zn-dependent dipeptidase